jgi:hypothetical protein
MAKMKLTVEGKLGLISLNSFVIVLDNSLSVLHSLDRRISEQHFGTIRWVIAHVVEGNSVELEIEPKVIRGQYDYRRQVLVGFTEGVDQIKKEGTTPRYFDYDDIKYVIDIVRQFGKDGLEGVSYSVEEYDKKAALTTGVEENIEKIIGIHYHTLGSIEGRIELISVHKGSSHFNIYHDITQRAIRCSLPKEYEPDIFKAAEGRSRVIATGRISYNMQGEPIRVHIMKPLRFLKEEEALPSIQDILGSAPDITGDLCTEEFIRLMRE